MQQVFVLLEQQAEEPQHDDADIFHAVVGQQTLEVVLGQELWRPDMMEEDARTALGI